MHRIEFHEPRNAFEVREPFVAACAGAAALSGLYANFQQPQQQVWREQKDGRKLRIGNGKHKSWSIDFQAEQLGHNHPTVVARVFLQSAIKPHLMQFGGFCYENDASGKPYTYSEVTLLTPTELGLTWRPLDPSPQLYADTVHALDQAYGIVPLDGASGQRALF